MMVVKVTVEEEVVVVVVVGLLVVVVVVVVVMVVVVVAFSCNELCGSTAAAMLQAAGMTRQADWQGQQTSLVACSLTRTTDITCGLQLDNRHHMWPAAWQQTSHVACSLTTDITCGLQLDNRHHMWPAA